MNRITITMLCTIFLLCFSMYNHHNPLAPVEDVPLPVARNAVKKTPDLGIDTEKLDAMRNEEKKHFDDEFESRFGRLDKTSEMYRKIKAMSPYEYEKLGKSPSFLREHGVYLAHTPTIYGEGSMLNVPIYYYQGETYDGMTGLACVVRDRNVIKKIAKIREYVNRG